MPAVRINISSTLFLLSLFFVTTTMRSQPLVSSNMPSVLA